MSGPDVGGGVPDGSDALADAAGLRRVERFAVAWTVVAALVYALAVSWPAALALTAASAASIVGFRGLQRIVSALGPPENQPAGRPEPSQLPDQPESAGILRRRPGLSVLVRLGLLLAVAAAAAFLLEPEHYPAIVLGFSTLPAAFMTEGIRQAVRAFRGRGRKRHDGS